MGTQYKSKKGNKLQKYAVLYPKLLKTFKAAEAKAQFVSLLWMSTKTRVLSKRYQERKIA